MDERSDTCYEVFRFPKTTRRNTAQPEEGRSASGGILGCADMQLTPYEAVHVFGSHWMNLRYASDRTIYRALSTGCQRCSAPAL